MKVVDPWSQWCQFRCHSSRTFGWTTWLGCIEYQREHRKIGWASRRNMEKQTLKANCIVLRGIFSFRFVVVDAAIFLFIFSIHRYSLKLLKLRTRFNFIRVLAWCLLDLLHCTPSFPAINHLYSGSQLPQDFSRRPHPYSSLPSHLAVSCLFPDSCLVCSGVGKFQRFLW